MKKFSGSKGKWQMTTSALECDHNSEVATIWGDSEHGEGACLIAHIDNSPGFDTAMANGKLIAAAPELLEALMKTSAILGKITGVNPENKYKKTVMQYSENVKLIEKILQQ
jgi:hypothetical protein